MDDERDFNRGIWFCLGMVTLGVVEVLALVIWSAVTGVFL